MADPSYVRVWIDPDGVNGDIQVDFIRMDPVRVAIFRGPDGEFVFDTNPELDEEEREVTL